MDAAEIIRTREAEIRQQCRCETAVVVDNEGNIILEKTSEIDYEVAFTEEEVTLIRAAKGAIFTHNHPRGWEYEPDDPRHAGHSFSPEDIFLACRMELAEIRAITPVYCYSMQPPSGGWDESFWNVLWTIYQTEYAEVNHELTFEVIDFLHKSGHDGANLCHDGGMFYHNIKDYAPKKFKRLTGVSKEPFALMVEVLRANLRPFGRPPDLCLEDRLLMVLMYWREYRTQEHIGETYGVSEATVSRTVKQFETILIQDTRFHLPGKKALRESETLFEVVLIDATECPIERPKKTPNSVATTRARRNDTPTKPR